MSRCRAGFSYIEVLLALSSFAIGFASQISMNGYISQQNMIAREIAAATFIGQSLMEQFRAQGYENLTDNGPLDGMMGPLDVQGEASPTGKYIVTWDVRDNTPVADVKYVLVTVQWENVLGSSRKVQLETVFGAYSQSVSSRQGGGEEGD